MQSKERPLLREGDGTGSHVFFVDFREDLIDSDTISAVTVTEETSSDLTIGTPTIGAAAQVIEEESVPASQWFKFTVSGYLAATATYELRVKYSTDGGVSNVTAPTKFVFDVEA